MSHLQHRLHFLLSFSNPHCELLCESIKVCSLSVTCFLGLFQLAGRGQGRIMFYFKAIFSLSFFFFFFLFFPFFFFFFFFWGGEYIIFFSFVLCKQRKRCKNSNRCVAQTDQSKHRCQNSNSAPFLFHLLLLLIYDRD